MPRFLIDVNLPYWFELWRGEDYVHARDLNDEWTDSQLWQFAKEHDLTIVSKDSDFSYRILLSVPPPRVIHIRFGNLKMREFHITISRCWNEVLELTQRYKLVNVFRDRVEGIG